MIGTSKPFTGAMRGTVHEPQANLGADQKFSPVNVLKQKKGGKPWDFNGLIKCQTAPLSSLQNGQVTKSNKERFAKDRIRLHELSPILKGQSICVFQKNQNQNHKIGKECHEHCTTFHYIALLHTKSAFQDKGCMHLHP